ncbi:MAG: hypothetical protein ACYTFV_02520 [Planctomycetota bacterium]|jgi:hypothetical protein
MTHAEINDATGFANGARFANPAEVYAYFTPAAQAGMFGDEAVTDAATLLGWAEAVIDNGWHRADSWGAQGAVEATFEEQGNGLPSVGDHVTDGDWLYRVVEVGSYVHTHGPGRGNTCHGKVVEVDWNDCDDDQIHSARVSL